MHYKVQFTADQAYMELLEEARDLLAHDNPTRDFVEVQRKALEVLVSELRKRKHACRADAAPEVERRSQASASPTLALQDDDSTKQPHSKPARQPSAAVARAVWQRDQGRCTYTDARGQRCRETAQLEYHHEHAYALGGAATLDNLTLRCRAHNALAAERDFGKAFMDRMRHPEREQIASE